MKSSKRLMTDYLRGLDWRKKENSNSPPSIGALNKYFYSEVNKDHWLNEVYKYPIKFDENNKPIAWNDEISQAYVNNRIHIHDLGESTIYCCGYSLKEVLLKGVKGVSNIPTSGPAKHFDSVLNQISNLITVFQNEIAGAVAFNSVDTLLAPFIKKDNLSYDQVKQSMQNFIFSINSNSRGGSEPAFSNITLDLTPPDDLLNEYVIIGGHLEAFTYATCQREQDMFNKAFCEIMLNGDAEGKLFSYPIPTYNIHNRFDWDNPNNRLLWEMAGKYGTPYFANFLNSDMDPKDIRSMCPLHPSENVLVYNDTSEQYQISNISSLYNGNKKEKKWKVILDGKIKEATINQFEVRDFYEVTTINNQKIIISGNHLNLTQNGVKETVDLTLNDYLPFNSTPFDGQGFTYEDGLIVGAYCGDGCSDNESGMTFSMNMNNKKDLLLKIKKHAENRFGAKTRLVVEESKETSGHYGAALHIKSKSLLGMIKEFISGNYGHEKEITKNILNKSLEFKKGVLDGYYGTDGGNRGRIYTSSKKMVNSLVLMLNSMGIPSSVAEDNREDRLSTNTVYIIKFYTRSCYSDLYYTKDNKIWFKIKSIEKLNTHNSHKYGYCFEVLNDEKPYFIMPNGMITHNCRLRLDLSELRRKNGGLFGSGDSTGSIGVVTINLPRLAYENNGNVKKFFKELDYLLNLSKNSLLMKKQWIQENIFDTTNMIPAFKEYVGTLDNHFMTIGVIGMNEMCLNMFGKSILSPRGKKFALEVGNHIRKRLSEFQEETGQLFNYEATPAESTTYRFALRDRKDYPDIIQQGKGRDCYYTNSCHIPVDLITSIDETFKNQNELQTQFTGGTVIHIFLDGAITGDQAKETIKNVLTNYKVPYVSLSPISRYCDNKDCSGKGYIVDLVDKCPVCKSRLKMYQRITGYLREVGNFNRGKKAEFDNRVQLTIDEQNEEAEE